MQWSDVVPHLTGLAHLATTDSRAHPGIAVVSPLVDGDAVWFQTRAGSRKARNVAEVPHVALIWQGNGEAYLWGDAVVVTDVAEKRRRWTEWNYDAASFFGDPADDGVVLVRIAPSRATVLAAGDAGPVRSTWHR